MSCRWWSDLQTWFIQEHWSSRDHDVCVLRPQRGLGVLRSRHRRRLRLEGAAAAENGESPRRAGVCHVLPGQGEEERPELSSQHYSRGSLQLQTLQPHRACLFDLFENLLVQTETKTLAS